MGSALCVYFEGRKEPFRRDCTKLGSKDHSSAFKASAEALHVRVISNTDTTIPAAPRGCEGLAIANSLESAR